MPHTPLFIALCEWIINENGFIDGWWQFHLGQHLASWIDYSSKEDFGSLYKAHL
jgi:hypothetical protein